MKHVSRRSFLKTSAVVMGAAALSARSWSQVAGANGDVRVAVVGLNGRGRNHLQSLARIPGVRVVALCDVDTAVLDRVKALTVDGKQPYAQLKTYIDVRELLASNDVDAVTLATPNHLHALHAIWACEAGKDVYVEKPVSHNVWEGRQLVAAAAKYNRIVQAGMQVRSGEGLREAVEWVRAGNIGKITVARGFCYKRRDSIGKTGGPQPIPATINYDLWSGPAPLVPPRRNSERNGPVHYDWHWIYLYGNGDVGNQGIHQMDVARWFLGEPRLPRRTLSIGGRLGYVDDGETPNTQVIVHDYATAPLIFEVRGLPAVPGEAKVDRALTGAEAAGAASATMSRYRGVDIGNVIDCEGGYIVAGSYFSATAHDREGKVLKRFQGEDRMMENFIDTVRSRRSAELFGQIEEGHISSALCHLGNVSHRLGQTASPAVLAERLKNDGRLAEAAGRMFEHLAVNRVDLAATPLTIGAALEFDPKSERFVGDGAEAGNRLLAREYRAPFVVPKLA